GKIIISEDYPDVVSTGFGAVYTDETGVFLNVTNDYVCDGVVCGATPLTIYDATHDIISVQSWTNGKSDLTLVEKVLGIEASLDVDVQLDAGFEASTGHSAIMDVLIDAELEAAAVISSGFNTDIDVLVGALLETDVAIAAGVTGRCDAELIIDIDSSLLMDVSNPVSCSANCNLVIEPGLNATAAIGGYVSCACDRDIILDIDMTTEPIFPVVAIADTGVAIVLGTDCSAEVYNPTLLKTDTNIVMIINPDCNFVTDGIDYGQPGGVVGECSADNTDDLSYGASL
ncbi:MAG: hypothetical protein U9N61_13130, partial [Euryarchaeota archaeon]|nr:hypothetical protein [Euryarchaeota archaeon]